MCARNNDFENIVRGVCTGKRASDRVKVIAVNNEGPRK